MVKKNQPRKLSGLVFRANAFNNCLKCYICTPIRISVFALMSRQGQNIGRTHIQYMKTVPLGTEYSVPNGTEKLGFVISFTDILSLTGHYFLNAFALGWFFETILFC